jgi:hypothetical protein
VTSRQLERLAAAGINLLPALELAHHYVFERDGFISLVERTQSNSTGSIGAPGLLTEKGFAALVWRTDRPWFVAKGFEEPARDEQVAAIRRFTADLETALKK